MQETFALGEISFTHVEVPLRYDEYVKNHDENNNVTNYSKFYQAEEYTAKSYSSITPQSNRKENPEGNRKTTVLSSQKS